MIHESGGTRIKANLEWHAVNNANLEQAVEADVFGKFLHQGQTCMSVNRFIIDDRVHDEFLERFTDRVRQLKVDDPNAPDTMIGPFINESQLNGLHRRIHDAISSGAHQIVGGKAQGLVLPPHVFSQVTNQMPLAQTESWWQKEFRYRPLQWCLGNRRIYYRSMDHRSAHATPLPF